MTEKISKKEVERIAKLSHIELNEGDVTRLQKDMEEILEYVDVIEKADVASIKPTSHTVDIFNVLREDGETLDAAKKDLQTIEQDKFQRQAPDWENGYFKTKPIFGQKE